MLELVEQVAAYLRVDEEDPTLEPLVGAAVKYIERSTGIAFRENDAVYTTAVKMLAAHWYDNRGMLGPNTAEIPFSVESLLIHIKLCGDYRE